MTNDTAAQAELPSAPAPALTTGGAPGLVLNAQPKATNPMSLELESDKPLRLRGGCGCIDGGIDVETGWACIHFLFTGDIQLYHRPCVCDTDSYGCLGVLADSISILLHEM